MEPGEIRGEQVGEGIRITVLPPRPGARPVVLSAGPAPRHQQSRKRGARTLWWVVAGPEIGEDRGPYDYITRHWDDGIARRSALRRAAKLAKQPRSKK